MCKKCKDCGKSNLGVVVTHIETIAVRMLDGVITEQFADSATDNQTSEINYCFECNKPITEEDLFEDVQCPICGKMVGGLTESGACQGCADEADILAKMSKEQLILMLMKQAHTGAPIQVTNPVPVCGTAVAAKEGADTTTVPKEEDKKEEEITDTSLLEDSIKAAEASALKEASEIEEEMKEADGTAAKKTRTRKKPEAAAITEEGVNTAKEEITEMLEEVEVTKTVDPNTVVDGENTAALTTINDGSAVPIANPSDDVDAILKELDGVGNSFENGGEIF